MKLTTTTLLYASLTTGAHALFGGKEPPKPKPHIIDDFQWTDPFISPEIASFDADCEHVATFSAREFTLADLSHAAPKGLADWMPGLKKLFTGREYPGSWGGLDRHQGERAIISMEYKDVPLPVRLWIEEQERTQGDGRGLFGIFEKVEEGKEEKIEETVAVPSAAEVDRSLDAQRLAVFAPGAIYHILPLWAAETSTCENVMTNLDNYQVTPKDGAVVGWVEHKRPKETEMEFRVKVKSLKAKSGAGEAETSQGGDNEKVEEKVGTDATTSKEEL